MRVGVAFDSIACLLLVLTVWLDWIALDLHRVLVGFSGVQVDGTSYLGVGMHRLSFLFFRT
jgi:hypothetical protein